MKLKRVRIFGFKTFADRTEFTIDADLVAVVGPNGCGKSNLVDAILWGLGEGSARQLRAQTGQDVIFNGSARRKGVGFAEVSLVFDNDDGGLPVESGEVAITRRLTRSGESEYSINRQPCRQRDIFELLADSGLGRSGYAIVGQKEIDQALNASAEERRAWIDEAAGVQRYRQRKSESQRRLASAQDHLQRVDDILLELEGQREPLREEAEVATRYRSIQTTLQEIEIGFLVTEARLAREQQTQAEESISRSAELIQAESRLAERLNVELANLDKGIAGLDAEIEALRRERESSLRNVEHTESDIRLAKQRLEGLEERERSIEADREELQRRILESEKELDLANAEACSARDALDELRLSVAGIGDEAQGLARALDEAERALLDARKQEAQRLKGETERLHLIERQKQAQRELMSLRETLPDLESAIDEAQQSVTAAQNGSQALGEALAARRRDIDAIEAEETADSRTARELMSKRAALEGRRTGIEATIDSHEGIAQGARVVLDAMEEGALEGNFLPVAEAISVEKGHALAIETALGGAANDLIVADELLAKAAIEWLKANRAGRATFQPLTLVREIPPSDSLRRLSKDPRVIGVAADLVKCAPAHKAVIQSLLGRIIVLRSLGAAFEIARNAREADWVRLVTLEGEVIHKGGAVTGGQNPKQGYGIVQRKADLSEIGKALEALGEALQEFEHRSASRQAKLAELSSNLEEERLRLGQAERDLAEQERYLRTLESELQSTLKEQQRLQRELELPVPAKSAVTQILGEIEANRDKTLKALAARSADVAQTQQRLIDADKLANEASQRQESAGRRLENARAAATTRERRAEALEPERAKNLEEIDRHRQELEELAKARKELEAQMEALAVRRSSDVDSKAATHTQITQVRENVAAIEGGMHQAELNRVRAEARRATAVARLADEYGMSPENSLAAEQVTPAPPSDAQAVVHRLRRELRSMGEVNLGAIEAFRRLTDRFEGLGAQRDDVLGGILEVEQSIRELDKMTRDRFVMTLDQVAAAFSQTFDRLFGGGEGHLSLTDPEDTLNSGIEIEVTLPGKRKQYLNLLSGGERALCCCAFLFSLLRVKPSPLVILDEIDAPLDGRNIERFTGMLLDFDDRTQFLVVTHNPVTIAAAPVWIGVSMEEPGVSKLIPVKAPERRSELAAALTD